MRSAQVPRRKPIASVLSPDRRRLATGNFQLAELSQVPSANCEPEVAEMSLGMSLFSWLSGLGDGLKKTHSPRPAIINNEAKLNSQLDENQDKSVIIARCLGGIKKSAKDIRRHVEMVENVVLVRLVNREQRLGSRSPRIKIGKGPSRGTQGIKIG